MKWSDRRDTCFGCGKTIRPVTSNGEIWTTGEPGELLSGMCKVGQAHEPAGAMFDELRSMIVDFKS